VTIIIISILTTIFKVNRS